MYPPTVFCCLYNLYSTQKNLQPTFLEKKCPPKPQLRNYIENKKFMRPYIFYFSCGGLFYYLSIIFAQNGSQVPNSPFLTLGQVGVHGSSIYIFDLVQVTPYSPFERDVVRRASYKMSGIGGSRKDSS